MTTQNTNRAEAVSAKPVTYGLIEKRDLDAATRIYLEHFPQRVSKWFSNPEQAREFYGDYFEFVWLAYPQSFFAARAEGQLVGYLILSLPAGPLAGRFGAMFREGLIFRAAARALIGRYGFRLVGQVLKHLFGATEDARLRCPHVDVIVVEKGYESMGIGSALLEQARAFVRGRYPGISLYVEADNPGALRLYERLGFRIVKSDAEQHLMLWDVKPEGAGTTQPDFAAAELRACPPEPLRGREAKR